MKEGTVSYVSLVDKGSILVTLTLSVIILGEPFTWRVAAGAGLRERSGERGEAEQEE